MIIANLTEMSRHKFDEVYKYKNHQWINERLNCGCITAICIDVEPTDEDSKWLIRQFNKFASLQTYSREAANSPDENISNCFEKFEKELEITQDLLADFIRKKRREYNFPNSTDCNSECYFIKLKKDPNCNNNM
jgi:hypothetical protein